MATYYASKIGAEAKFYIDGKLDKTQTMDILDYTNTNSFRIGRDWDTGGASGTGYWTGKLDDIRVFNYALTPWQVSHEYDGGKPIAHWDF